MMFYIKQILFDLYLHYVEITITVLAFSIAAIRVSPSLVHRARIRMCLHIAIPGCPPT